MSANTKAPRMRIDQQSAPQGDVATDSAHDAAAASAVEGAEAKGPSSVASDAEGQPAGDAAQAAGGSAAPRLSPFAWVHRTFPGHEHAFWGAVIGLGVALLVFAIGLLRTLFIALVICIGVAVGQYLDGDPRILGVVERVVDGWRDRRS